MKKLVPIMAALVLSSPVMASEGGVCIAAQPTKESISATLHANYMPNFIPVLVNSEKELNLTAQQCQAFNKFRAEKAPKGKELIDKVNQLEQEATQAVLNGASKEDVMARHAKIAELRQKLVEGKLNCQAFVKKQLTDEQYQKLVAEVYPAKIAAAKQHFGL